MARQTGLVVSRKEQLGNLTKLDDKLADPKSRCPDATQVCKNAAGPSSRNFHCRGHLHTSGLLANPPPGHRPGGSGLRLAGRLLLPCHGSKFDLAGRVYKTSRPRPITEIPPHKYLSDTRVLIGDDK